MKWRLRIDTLLLITRIAGFAWFAVQSLATDGSANPFIAGLLFTSIAIDLNERRARP